MRQRVQDSSSQVVGSLDSSASESQPPAARPTPQTHALSSSVDSSGGSPSAARFVMTHEVASPAVPQQLHFRTPINRLSTRRYEAVGSSEGSVAKPDYDDCLRRTAVVVHRHVATCEARNRRRPDDGGLFRAEASRVFHEAHYATPRQRLATYRLPLTWTGFQFSMHQVVEDYASPSMEDVYDFLSTLFVRAHLSSECSVVCLIYVERLMDKGRVSLLAATWRPILLCSMLMASKVWQDSASWCAVVGGRISESGSPLTMQEHRVFRRLPPVLARLDQQTRAQLRLGAQLGHVHFAVALCQVRLLRRAALLSTVVVASQVLLCASVFE